MARRSRVGTLVRYCRAEVWGCLSLRAHLLFLSSHFAPSFEKSRIASIHSVHSFCTFRCLRAERLKAQFTPSHEMLTRTERCGS